LTCGLIKDNEIKDEALKLYDYGGIYFPENTYYNCDPIPIEWLELYQEWKTFIDIYEDENVLEQIGVNPFSSKKELDYIFESINFHEHKR